LEKRSKKMERCRKKKDRNQRGDLGRRSSRDGAEVEREGRMRSREVGSFQRSIKITRETTEKQTRRKRGEGWKPSKSNREARQNMCNLGRL
jgi:hypothetical protein